VATLASAHAYAMAGGRSYADVGQGWCVDEDGQSPFYDYWYGDENENEDEINQRARDACDARPKCGGYSVGAPFNEVGANYYETYDESAYGSSEDDSAFSCMVVVQAAGPCISLGRPTCPRVIADRANFGIP
jgi:hypothetical protein